MNRQRDNRDGAVGAAVVPLRDVTLVILAVAGLILANVGVVRALDVALDAIHR